MALEGPLKDLHIQDVFQLLDLGRKSGVLRVTSELRQTAATVCFDRGGVVAASLGSDPQPIGGRLVRVGKITAEQLHRGRALQNAGDTRRLGDILLSLGAISRRELERQVKAQIEEAVFELLAWTEGYFRFEEGSPCQAAVDAPATSITCPVRSTIRLVSSSIACISGRAPTTYSITATCCAFDSALISSSTRAAGRWTATTWADACRCWLGRAR